MQAIEVDTSQTNWCVCCCDFTGNYFCSDGCDFPVTPACRNCCCDHCLTGSYFALQWWLWQELALSAAHKTVLHPRICSVLSVEEIENCNWRKNSQSHTDSLDGLLCTLLWTGSCHYNRVWFFTLLLQDFGTTRTIWVNLSEPSKLLQTWEGPHCHKINRSTSPPMSFLDNVRANIYRIF